MKQDIEMTADEARSYVKWFSDNGIPGKKTTYIRTSEDRLIHFRFMTDEDAIWAAKALKRDLMNSAHGVKE